MGNKIAGNGKNTLKIATNGFLAALAVFALIIYFYPFKYEMVIDPGRIKSDQGKAYRAYLGSPPWPLAALSDNFNRNSNSTLTLYENGKPLGPAHSRHDQIRIKGGGAFSHWGDSIFFSTSDHSDPRTNGRRYSVRCPVHPSAPLLLILSLNLLRLVLRWFRTGFGPLADRVTAGVSAVPFAYKYLFLILCVFALILARTSHILFLPVMQAEDGFYFARFYNSGRPDMILLINAGYLRLTSNLLYYLTTHLPVRWAPYLLAWIPALLAVFTYSLLFARRYRALIPSDWTRFAVCLALVLSPLGGHLLLTNTDYSSWNMLLLLILLTLGGIPGRRPFLNFLLLNLTVWGTPLALAVFPVTVVLYFKDPSPAAKPYYFLTALNIIIHQWLAIDSAFLVLNMEMFIKWLLLTGHTLINQVVLFPLLGPQGAELVMSRFPHLAVAIFFGAAVLAARLLFPGFRRWAGYALYFITAITFTVMAGRETTYDFMGVDRHLEGRYHYVQSLLCLTLLVLCASQAIEKVVAAVENGWSRIKPLTLDPRAVRVGLWILVLAYMSLLNTIPYNRSEYRPADQRNGKLVRQFFADLAQAEKAPDSRGNISLRLDKFNDWPIVINTRRPD